MSKYVITENTWGETVIEKRVSSSEVAGVTLGLLALAGGAIWQSIKQSSAQSYAENAIRLVKKGEYEEGISYATRVVNMFTNEAEPYTIRGSCYWASGNHQKAIEDFSKAISINSAHGEFFGLRGQCYLEFGDLKSAISDFSRAIQLEPTRHYAYLWCGIALRKLGDLDLAMKNLNKAVELNPSDENTYRERSITHVQINEYQKAIIDLSCVLNLIPGSAEDHKLRGEVYRLIGNEEKCNADFKEASRIEEALQSAALSRPIKGYTTKTKNPFQGVWVCSLCGGQVEKDAEVCIHCEHAFKDTP